MRISSFTTLERQRYRSSTRLPRPRRTQPRLLSISFPLLTLSDESHSKHSTTTFSPPRLRSSPSDLSPSEQWTLPLVGLPFTRRPQATRCQPSPPTTARRTSTPPPTVLPVFWHRPTAPSAATFIHLNSRARSASTLTSPRPHLPPAGLSPIQQLLQQPSRRCRSNRGTARPSPRRQQLRERSTPLKPSSDGGSRRYRSRLRRGQRHRLRSHRGRPSSAPQTPSALTRPPDPPPLSRRP